MVTVTSFVRLCHVYPKRLSFALQAPWIPGEVHLSQVWQDRRLPLQRRVPELEVVNPPEYLRNDRRLPRKRNKAEDGTADDVVENKPA